MVMVSGHKALALFLEHSRVDLQSIAFSPRVFQRGEKVPKADEGGLA
jgi:hypothetical protein